MIIDWQKFVNASAFLLALPYFTGYVYLDAYYGFFGALLSELDVSDQRIYVNAFPALFLPHHNLIHNGEGWMAFMIHMLGIVAVVLILTQVDVTSSSRITLTDQLQIVLGPTAVIVLYYIFSLVLLYFMASQSGEHLAKKSLDHLEGVTVTQGVSEATKDPLEFIAPRLPSSERYKFLHATDKTLFLIRKTDDKDIFYLVRMPRRDTEMSFVRQDY